jgi:hypothetical protein
LGFGEERCDVRVAQGEIHPEELVGIVLLEADDAHDVRPVLRAERRQREASVPLDGASEGGEPMDDLWRLRWREPEREGRSEHGVRDGSALIGRNHRGSRVAGRHLFDGIFLCLRLGGRAGAGGAFDVNHVVIGQSAGIAVICLL